MAEPARKQEAPSPDAPKPAPPREPWLQWVALTTTVLAVCAAISALKGGGYATQVQVKTTKEANAWAYFQSKSIKQHAVELHRDALRVQHAELRAPEAQRLAAEQLAAADREIARYEKDKHAIQAEATTLAAEQEALKRHGGAFQLAVMLLQIAIMLSSVGALMKKPILWVVGLVFGAGGLTYMANGFWLFF